MALKRPEKEHESTYTPLNAGEYPGRLVYIADLGVHQDTYKGELKDPCRKFTLGIELIGETYEIEGEVFPKLMWLRPFNVYKKMTEKGGEFKAYKTFDKNAKPDTVPDWEAQLGKPCTVVVEHNSKEGKTYDNIESLLSVPDAFKDAIGEAQLSCKVNDADNPDDEVNQALFGLAKYVYDKRLEEEA